MSKMNALFEDSMGRLTDMLNADTTSNGEPLRLALDSVVPDPNQPREDFNEKALQELADSIEEHGVIQAISVAPINDAGVYVIKYGRAPMASVFAGKGCRGHSRVHRSQQR